MSDLISRQDAIDVLKERLRANGYSNVALVSELNRSIGYLMRLPSAEPKSVEVVRCGECKHMNPQGICMQFADFHIFPSVSDYCSKGERKTEWQED